MENKSEVALLRESIDQQFISSWQLIYGFRLVGGHRFRTGRMVHMSTELQQRMGKEEGMKNSLEWLEDL